MDENKELYDVTPIDLFDIEGNSITRPKFQVDIIINSENPRKWFLRSEIEGMENAQKKNVIADKKETKK